MAGDAEAEAIVELGARIRRLRTRVAAVAVVLGLVVGGVGYWFLRDLQLRREGVHAPFLTGGVSFAAGVAIIGLGWLVSRALVARRRDGWIAEIAERHGVDRAVLDGVASALR